MMPSLRFLHYLFSGRSLSGRPLSGRSGPYCVSARMRCEGGSAASLFVSLYLVVLAFFILLSSISHVKEDKKVAAMGSVQSKFQVMFELDEDVFMVSDSAGLGDEWLSSQYFGVLNKLARDVLALSDSSIKESGNHLQIDVPDAMLFQAVELPEDALKVSAAGESFLRRVAREVGKVGGESRIDVEIVLPVVTLPKTPTASASPAIAQAGLIARMLVDAGVRPEATFTGVSRLLPAGVVRMNFQHRSLFGGEALEEQSGERGAGNAQ